MHFKVAEYSLTTSVTRSKTCVIQFEAYTLWPFCETVILTPAFSYSVMWTVNCLATGKNTAALIVKLCFVNCAWGEVF